MVVWKNSGGFYSQTSQKHYSKKCPKISVLDAFNPDFGTPVFQDTFGILVLGSFDAVEFGTERNGGHRRGVWVPKSRKQKKNTKPDDGWPESAEEHVTLVLL